MTKRSITFEHLLYFLAFLLAAGLRFLNLGSAGLSELEAGWAMQALRVARGEPLAAAPLAQPAYIFLTGLTFTVLPATDALARFWPALSGSLLVLLPLFFRSALGRTAALICAFGLALDPGLVAGARTAGGPLMAASFALLALGFWRERQTVLAGLLAGLAVLSGPGLFFGLILAGLGLLVFRRSGWSIAHWGTNERPLDLRPALGAAAAVILLLGTYFFQVPQGLAGWFSGLADFLRGLIPPQMDAAPAGQILFTLMAYQPLALLFGLFGAFRILFAPALQPAASFSDAGRPAYLQTALNRRYTGLALVLWAGLALLLALLYPARQPGDLVWVIVPLWTLAALELSDFLPQRKVDWLAAGHAALIFIFLALFWFNLSAIGRAPGAGFDLRAGVMLGTLALVILTTVLIGLGWSWETGLYGFTWGVGVSLLAYLISASWGVSQLRSSQPVELWTQGPGVLQADLLRSTLEEISVWNTGFPDQIEILAPDSSASLQWNLRSFTHARFVANPASGVWSEGGLQTVRQGLNQGPPAVVITLTEDAPELAAGYRGQDFVYWVDRGWEGAAPQNLAGWITFRQAPLSQGSLYLWVRSDLFPDGAGETSRSQEIS